MCVWQSACVRLEAPVSQALTGMRQFEDPLHYVDTYRAARVAFVGQANNHQYDYGLQGMVWPRAWGKAQHTRHAHLLSRWTGQHGQHADAAAVRVGWLGCDTRSSPHARGGDRGAQQLWSPEQL